MKKLKALLQLMRPANIVTAISDVLAGIAISGFFVLDMEPGALWKPVILLCLSTIGLYGGGVVFNDVFDAALDKIERPERPIPRGAVTIREASVLAILLLICGIGFAYWWQLSSGLIAVTIAVASLVYDKWSKHHLLAGPLNMGLCRGLNLILGLSIIPLSVQQWWWLGIIPMIYIAAITLVSRGEVHGGRQTHIYLAVLLYALVIAGISYFAWTHKGFFLRTLFFLALFAAMIFTPLVKAIREPLAANIGKSVKAGVLGLILMNAAWACAVGNFSLAIFIVLLLPISLMLGKIFAVT